MLTNTYIIRLKFNTKLNFINFDLKAIFNYVPECFYFFDAYFMYNCFFTIL